MCLPINIIIQYSSFRDDNFSSTVNYHILYDEQKEVFEKIDIKNIISVDKSSSNLLLKLDVTIYDLSVEATVFGILNTLFKKHSSIDNTSSLTSNTNIIDNTYTIKIISLKDLVCSFYQFIKSKGHFARDMKTISKQWDIAFNKSYLAFSEEMLQDEDIIQLQKNRIHNNNDEIDTYKHFAIEQTIYNSLHSFETQNSDKFYFIYYRIGNTNNFYKFVMCKGADYKEFQGIQEKFNYIKIDFEEALDRCELFYELENETLENITKEQIEAIISNFVLINGGKKKIKEYIQYLDLEAFKKYDWNIQLDIATLNANSTDSFCSTKCSDFCPFYKNCNPIEDSMIETMKKRKPIEEIWSNIEYTEFYQARDELRITMERIIH